MKLMSLKMNWTIADYLQASYVCLTALSILVTAFMAWWVVKSVQRKLDTERTLRGHFAHEIIDLRKETREFIAELIKGGMTAKNIKYRHNHMRVHITDLQNILNKKYQIDKTILKAYKQSLIKIIERDDAYNNAFMENQPVYFSSETALALNNLCRDNDHLFNEILVMVYDKND